MKNDSQGGGFVPSEAIVSNEVRQTLEYVADFALVSLICYLGIVGNCVTIAIFRKQGYKETINISLTAIAIWDLMKCLCAAIYRLHGPIGAFSPALQITYRSFTSIAFAFPSYISGYVSHALAAYVSVERCLCVSLPFTVKYLLTPKLVTSMMTLLSLTTLSLFVVTFSMYEINWVFHSGLNATVAQKSLKPGFVDGASYKYYSILGFAWPVWTIAIQSVSTCIITYHLSKSSKFRAGIASSITPTDSKPGKGLSRRDRQVTKMLVVIIAIYIVNSIPRMASTLGKALVSDFYMYRYYHNLYASCLYLLNIFDFLNACINPLIYYFMSSQYKTAILKMFFGRKQSKGS